MRGMKIVIRKNGDLLFWAELRPAEDLDFTAGRLQHRTTLPIIAVNVALCDLTDKFRAKLDSIPIDYRIFQ